MMRQRAQDPEYRKNVSAGVIASKNRMTAEERSESARRSHTPESDAKRSASIRAALAMPESQARRAVTEALPETKARRSAAAVEINNRPGRRERQAELMRSKFASDPDFRARHSAALIEIFKDPLAHTTRSLSMQLAWLKNHGKLANSANALWQESRSASGRARRQNIAARRAARNPITPQEWMVAEALNELEVPYLIHKVIGGCEVDLYVPSLRLHIEVDGGNHVGEENEARDAVRDARHVTAGYRILRIPHVDFKTMMYITKLRQALDLPEAQ